VNNIFFIKDNVLIELPEEELSLKMSNETSTKNENLIVEREFLRVGEITVRKEIFRLLKIPCAFK
jgi:hypothetical protein